MFDFVESLVRVLRVGRGSCSLGHLSRYGLLLVGHQKQQLVFDGVSMAVVLGSSPRSLPTKETGNVPLRAAKEEVCGGVW